MPEKQKRLAPDSVAVPMIQATDFKRRFLSLILLAWMLPPVVGLCFILYLRILTPGQILGILVTPLEPIYIFGWLGFAIWYFPRSVQSIRRWLEQATPEAGAGALDAMRHFPLKFWAIFLIYIVVAPASVILSAEYYTDFIARPIDWFRIELVALIVSIIVGLPIFFRILDLFGQALGEIHFTRPHVTLKTKVFLVGALVPLLIDTMLVQYFWTRTGYFTVETFYIWLVLELLAVAGSLIFVRSISQSLSPLQSLIGKVAHQTEIDHNDMHPMSTDELGVLTAGYRQLLRDLSVRNERFQHLVESTTAIPWELDLSSWRFTYIGQQVEKVLGYPVEDWHQENFWQEHIHPDDVDYALNYCTTAISHSEDHDFEYRMLAADGRTVWIRDDVSIIHEGGKPVRLHGFMFDITQRKQAEINLTKSESSLIEAQRIAGLGSWELDIPADRLLWSEEIYRIFELEPSEFEPSYEAFLDAIHPHDRERVSQAYAHSLETRQPYNLEHRLLMSDGRVKHVREHCETRYNPAGEPLRSIGTVQDITERVRTEQELQRHRDELEQLVDERTAELSAVNQELESFSYSVSHDLRAPLRAIGGFSQALQEDCAELLGNEGCEYIERISSNVNRMTVLIDDLLNLSRLGRMEMTIESVDLARIANEIMSALGSAEPGRQVEFNIRLGGVVQADARFLRIVLENLLGNAWKYSRNEAHAKITLGETEHEGETAYFVRDNGAGFDMQYADKLFGAFQRLHSAQEFEGSGVGLATVARIIHRHGGKVWAESTPGDGAIFYFSLGASKEPLNNSSLRGTK